MKQIYMSVLLVMLFTVNVFGEQHASKFGEKEKVAVVYENNVFLKAEPRNSVDDALGCPPNTVLSGAFSSDADYMGQQSSDMGRADGATKFYQSFSGCYQKVNGIRWLGRFLSWDEENYNWLSCADRGGIDENGEMTEPIRFEVAFYEMGADGYPGKEVYRKEFDVLGKFTGVSASEYDDLARIYEFSVELDETICLESGFFSVAAAKVDNETHNCAFSVFTCSNVPGIGLIWMEAYEEYMTSQLSMCYCLTGDGDYIAQKALKFERLLSPLETASDKYEKVQVEVMNIGEQAISDAKLQLYLDDKLLATEELGVTIASMESYKHTFDQRIDCSQPGKHNIEIRNVTEGDEQIAHQSMFFSITKREEGIVCESYSTDASYEYITSVKIGSISNPSEGNVYSDFSDMKTSIKPGEVLDLNVECEGGSLYIGAWVDWNGNGSFDEAGEFIGYLPKGTIKVSIPDEAVVVPGERRLRIIASYEDILSACGQYGYGETEDYTLVVEHSDNSPIIKPGLSIIDSYQSFDVRPVTLEIKNEGSAELTGTASVLYALPHSPGSKQSAFATKNSKPSWKFTKSAKSHSVKAKETESQAEFVLRYDNGLESEVSLSGGSSAVYAQYFPGNMLAGLSGMQISSVDVYINDVPDKAQVVIFGQGSQSNAGNELMRQTFSPIAQSWNHIVLEQPLTIGNTDLWIGVNIDGFEPTDFVIGIDGGHVQNGFGDMVKLGNTWWSAGDLGLNSNFCIRANVTGNRTPTINWLSLDKYEFSVAPSVMETLTVSLDATQLQRNTLYEAQIVLANNDAVSRIVKIPVYLNNDRESKVEFQTLASTVVYTYGGYLVVQTDKALSSISLVNMNGAVMKMQNVDGYTTNMSLDNLQTGIYICCIVHADGSRENVKIPVVR